MTFISVQQETLLTNIIKSWVYYLKNTWNFAGVNFRNTTPDTEIDLVLPIIVLKRVSNDTWSNNRIWGYHWTNWDSEDSINTLYWYTYTSLIQFDIMWTTSTECNKLQGFLYKALQWTSIWSRTHIPIRDFVGVDKVWTPTDLQMKFYFNKDIDWAIIPSFDPNLHIASISVNFSVDYLSEKAISKILDIENDITLDI